MSNEKIGHSPLLPTIFLHLYIGQRLHKHMRQEVEIENIHINWEIQDPIQIALNMSGDQEAEH